MSEFDNQDFNTRLHLDIDEVNLIKKFEEEKQDKPKRGKGISKKFSFDNIPQFTRKK